MRPLGTFEEELAVLAGTVDARARAAYEAGMAAAQGDDSPLPPDSVIETIIDGVPTRVLLVEVPRDA